MSFRKWLHDLFLGSEPMTEQQKEMADEMPQTPFIPPPPRRTGEPIVKSAQRKDEW